MSFISILGRNTPYRVDQVVKIVRNRLAHHFPIGEYVRLTGRVNHNGNFQAESIDEYRDSRLWWIGAETSQERSDFVPTQEGTIHGWNHLTTETT